MSASDPSLTAERVGTKTRAGISWNLLGAFATNAMRVVVIAVLGRSLNSADFGVVSVAISVNTILIGVRDIGIGTALVQRKDLTPAHVTTAFALSTYLGLAVALGLTVAAPFLSDEFGVPDSAGVIRALSLLFVIRGVSTTARMMAQREMNFRAIALIDAMSFLVGSLVSMILAVLGAGYWALTLGYLAEEVVSSGAYVLSQRTDWGLKIDGARLRELMTFGTGQSIGYVLGTLAHNGDNFVVGHVLGARPLGYYARAYDLIRFPSTVFQAIVGSVLFPAFARFQDAPERLAAHFRRVTFLNALVLLPASAALIVLAPEVIRVLMGANWDSAVLPFQILSISILMRTGQRLGAIVAQAAGAVNGIAVVYGVYLVLVVGGAAFAIRWGLAGVAASTAIAIACADLGCSYLSIQISGLRWSAFGMAHVSGALIAAVIGAVGWPVASTLRAREVGTLPILALVGGLMILIALAGVALGLRSRSGDFTWARAEVARFRGRKAK